MRILFNTLLLVSCSFLSAQRFQETLAKTKKLPIKNREAYFTSYVESQSDFPIIEKDDVIFITKTNSGQPYLLADFNGFLNPRYTEDKSIGLMESIEGTSWYYFTKKLNPDAVINYKYESQNIAWLDSLNSKKRSVFGDTVSFIRLGNNFEKILPTHERSRGKLTTLKIESEIQKHTRTIHVYTPFNYESAQDLATIYFHDGSFFTEEMRVTDIMDHLISNQLIEPVVAIFDNPVIRGKEYRGDASYMSYISEELIPYISKNYKVNVSRDTRAVIGFSRGGMSAFYLAYFTNMFSKLGALSPAIHPTPIDDFMSKIGGFSGQPDQVFLTGALYDYFWYADALSLHRNIKQQGIEVNYIENAQGHNIPSWQTQIDDMLIAFFSREK